MNHPDDELRQATALFRYGVIADLVHLPVGTPGLLARMRDKAAQTYAIPGTSRTRIAANTIRDWIKLYRDGGFEALLSARTITDGAVFRLFDGHWDPVVERSDSWPGAAWSSTGQVAARLLRFATALRVTRCRPRDRVLPWP